MLRATLAGLLAFLVSLVALGALLSSVLPDAWSVDALSAVGFAAIAVDAAVGGFAGSWVARRSDAPVLLGAVLGPLLGSLLILAANPDASLGTAAGLVVILLAAGASARAAPGPANGGH